MSVDKKGTDINRLLWGALACLAMATSIYACSQQSAPTSPSGVDVQSEAEHSHADTPSENSPNVASQLAIVRKVTAKYHDLAAALADGYQLGFRGGVVTGCIANPALGAMGYHYFNWAKMDDPSIHEDDPEVLVYHRSDDGTLVLGAVEWVVHKPTWEQAGNAAAPIVFGTTMHVLNPVLNWYVAHAWIWTHNPSGMFADWNPEVTCP